MNWTTTNTPTHFKQEGDKALKKLKKERKEKKYKLVQVSSTPVTYKEVEVK